MDNPSDFFSWLALQPPFMEVALGAFFCLIVAPTLLAGVAIAVTALEALAETHLTLLLASRQTRGGHFPRARTSRISGIRPDVLP